MMKKIAILALIILCVPSVVLAAYKPSRVLFPEINGVVCGYDEKICMEEISRLSEAKRLLNYAKNKITISMGELDFEPKFIFCSTQKCYESFGFSRSRATNVGKSGVVIGPRGWLEHIVTHELIHQWQNHRFGILSVFFAEEWLIEGMAYAESGDPRKELTEPWETYRQRYIQWRDNIDKDDFVKAVKNEL